MKHIEAAWKYQLFCFNAGSEEIDQLIEDCIAPIRGESVADHVKQKYRMKNYNLPLLLSSIDEECRDCMIQQIMVM